MTSSDLGGTVGGYFKLKINSDSRKPTAHPVYACTQNARNVSADVRVTSPEILVFPAKLIAPFRQLGSAVPHSYHRR